MTKGSSKVIILLHNDRNEKRAGHIQIKKKFRRLYTVDNLPTVSYGTLAVNILSTSSDYPAGRWWMEMAWRRRRGRRGRVSTLSIIPPIRAESGYISLKKRFVFTCCNTIRNIYESASDLSEKHLVLKQLYSCLNIQ